MDFVQRQWAQCALMIMLQRQAHQLQKLKLRVLLIEAKTEFRKFNILVNMKILTV